MTVSVALIGSGVQAKGAYLPTILDNPELSLVAVYSRTIAAAAALCSSLPKEVQSQVRVFGNDASPTSAGTFDDVLADATIQALVIALPIQSQAPFVSAALKSGKHVLSEKPIAHNAETATDLIREYRSLSTSHGGQVWYIAENWSLIPIYDHAVKSVRQLGRVLGFRTRQSLMMGADSPFLASGWRAQLNGGLLLDGAVHGIAVLRLLLGAEHDLTRVSAFTHALQSHLPGPDTMDVIVRASSGITGVMQMSYGTTFDGPVFEIACEQGVVRIDGFDSVTVTPVEGKPQQSTGGGLGESFAAVVQAWTAAIEGRGTDKRLSPEEAVDDVAIIQAMLASAASDGAPANIQVRRDSAK